ncbi:MAG: hypothetical protein R2860_05880 [Desulfobacterales bacterium]
MADINFQDRYHVTPLSVYRHEETYRAKIGDIVVQVGDVITLYGTWKRLMELQKEGALLFSLPSDVEEMRPEKALWAGFWLITALTMIMGFKIQLSVSLMTGALGMVLTRVLNIDEAYQAVDWRTIFLLAGLIPWALPRKKPVPPPGSPIRFSVLSAMYRPLCCSW